MWYLCSLTLTPVALLNLPYIAMHASHAQPCIVSRPPGPVAGHAHVAAAAHRIKSALVCVCVCVYARTGNLHTTFKSGVGKDRALASLISRSVSVCIPYIRIVQFVVRENFIFFSSCFPRLLLVEYVGVLLLRAGQ